MSRRSQLGIMRAVGAKPRQIRRLIFGEAIYISMFSIPIGILTALGFAKLFIVLGAKSMGKAANAASKLYIPKINCFIGIFLIVAAVLLAVAIPAYKAGKASPLEAISGKTGYISTKKNKTGAIYRFFMRRFGISLNIALQNIWRNKKAALITVLCMSICGALYLGENNKQCSIDNYNRKAAQNEKEKYPFIIYKGEYAMENHGYDIPMIGTGYTQKDYDNILNTDGVRKAEAIREDWNIKFLAGKGYITNEYKKYIKGFALSKDDQVLLGSDTVRSGAIGVRTEVLKKSRALLKEGSINIEEMKSKPIVLLTNTTEYYEKNKLLKISRYKAGDTVKLTLPFIINGKREERTYSCIIGGILSDNARVCIKQPSGMPAFVFHKDMLKKLTNSSLYQGIYVSLNKGLSRNRRKEIGAKMKSIALSIPQGNFSDSAKEGVQYESMVNQQRIIEAAILWSLIVIAIVNIFNTASTNLYMRMKEFGLMKIVGITMRQLKCMVFIEMSLYGIASTIFAFAFGLIVGYKDIRGIGEYIISWKALAIVFAGYMVFSLLAAVMPLWHIKKCSAVESIRTVE